MFPGFSVPVSGSVGSPGLAALSGPAGVPVVPLSVSKMGAAVGVSPGAAVISTRAARGCVGVVVFMVATGSRGPTPIMSMLTWGSMSAAVVV